MITHITHINSTVLNMEIVWQEIGEKCYNSVTSCVHVKKNQVSRRNIFSVTIIELKAALEKANSQHIKYQKLYRNANGKSEQNNKIGQYLKNIQRISVDIDVNSVEAIKLLQNLDNEKHKDMQTYLAELLNLATAIDTEIYFEHSIFSFYKGTVKERFSTIWYPSGDGFEKDYTGKVNMLDCPGQ